MVSLKDENNEDEIDEDEDISRRNDRKQNQNDSFWWGYHLFHGNIADPGK